MLREEGAEGLVEDLRLLHVAEVHGVPDDDQPRALDPIPDDLVGRDRRARIVLPDDEKGRQPDLGKPVGEGRGPGSRRSIRSSPPPA